MWIQVFGLSCLLGVLTAQNPATTPKNFPECKVMDRAAQHMKTGIKTFLQKDSECKVNPHCTGVRCTWSGGGYLEVDLHHCIKPISYHVLFNAPGSVFRNLTLYKDDEKKLYDGKIGTVKLKVTELKREGNIVTTTVQLELCAKIGCFPPTVLLNQQKFCVRMQNCPGFNASAVHYKPCGFMPSGPPPTGHSTDHSTNTFRSTSSGHVPRSFPERSTSTGADPSATGSYNAHKGKHHNDDSSLSTAAIIGICAAAIIAILIVVGVVVYWKKYHHRSRLRAAYYNDISMHDPLYEDFGGPEVA